MMISDRAKIVLGMIKDGRDHTLLKEIENSPQVNSIEDFKSAIEILLVLIEKSSHSGTAIVLFIDWTTSNRYQNDLPQSAIRSAINQCLRDLALEPYQNVSAMLGRFIIEMLRSDATRETNQLSGHYYVNDLLDVNDFYLNRYLGKKDLDKHGLALLYNCVENVLPNLHILLSKKSLKFFRKKLDEQNSGRFYLESCIRPYYITDNRYFPEAGLHVIEPFYEQIFGSIEGFIIFIRQYQTETTTERLLQDELLRICLFVKQSGDNRFDIGRIGLTSKLHRNARVLGGQNSPSN